MKTETTTKLIIGFTSQELAEAMRMHASDVIMRHFKSCINAGIKPAVYVTVSEHDNSASLEVTLTETA